MIYCVWYPSGGFGHFINAVLTLHGDNFVRPKNSLKFSNNGNSHNLDLVVPKYRKGSWTGNTEFIENKNYSLLVDNGINNESDAFKATLPRATVIKICYCEYSWPAVARAMIEKAMGSSIKEQLPITNWDTDEPWACREKYFLFLRDHPLRFSWKKVEKNSLDVRELYEDYNRCYTAINSIVKTEDFYELWVKWRKANARYIDPVQTASKVLSWVICKKSEDLTHITDTWTQSVIYYYIWFYYGVEVPHNDYSDWFTNTKDIITMLDTHGVAA